MAITAPYLPYEKLRAVADCFLKQYHPSGYLPVPIEKIIEFQLKLDIVPVPGLQDGFDIDAFITNDLTEIRVDSFIQQKRPARYRFSLAHEVAHLLIHKDVFKELKFSSIKEWKEAFLAIPEEEYAWIEWQAYCLGGLILVPGQPLKALFEVSLEKAMKAGIDLRELDAEGRKIIEDNLGRLHFDVSREVITRRMEKDKLWK
jgi:hypothetical protein